MAAFAVSWKATLDRGFGAFYKLKIKVVLGITNQKIANGTIPHAQVQNNSFNNKFALALLR